MSHDACRVHLPRFLQPLASTVPVYSVCLATMHTFANLVYAVLSCIDCTAMDFLTCAVNHR